MENTEDSVTIEVPKDITVFEDKKTRVKTMALSFTFPDYSNGILSITKLVKFPWQPNIASITINFKKPNENKPIA